MYNTDTLEVNEKKMVRNSTDFTPQKSLILFGFQKTNSKMRRHYDIILL